MSAWAPATTLVGTAMASPMLAFELEQQALGGFLADARHFDDAAALLKAHRPRQLVDAQPGK